MIPGDDAHCRLCGQHVYARQQRDELAEALRKAQPILERLALEGNSVAEDVRNDVRVVLAKVRS